MTTLGKNTEMPSNFDRLRSYLKGNSLELALMETWVKRTNEHDGARSMIDTLDSFNNSTQEDDEQNASEKN